MAAGATSVGYGVFAWIAGGVVAVGVAVGGVYYAGLIGPEAPDEPDNLDSVEDVVPDEPTTPQVQSPPTVAPLVKDEPAQDVTSEAGDNEKPQDIAESKGAPETVVPDPSLAAPVFDVVRVDPDGNAVIAGTGPAGAQVTILLDGEEQVSAIVDRSGAFVSLLSIAPSGSARVLSMTAALDGQSRASEDQIILAPATRTEPEPVEDIVVATVEPAVVAPLVEAEAVKNDTGNSTGAAEVSVPVAEPVVEPVPESIVEPVVETEPESVAEPIVEPVTDQTAEPVSEPAPKAVQSVEVAQADPVEKDVAALDEPEPAIEDIAIVEAEPALNVEAPLGVSEDNATEKTVSTEVAVVQTGEVVSNQSPATNMSVASDETADTPSASPPLAQPVTTETQTAMSKPPVEAESVEVASVEPTVPPAGTAPIAADTADSVDPVDPPVATAEIVAETVASADPNLAKETVAAPIAEVVASVPAVDPPESPPAKPAKTVIAAVSEPVAEEEPAAPNVSQSVVQPATRDEPEGAATDQAVSANQAPVTEDMETAALATPTPQDDITAVAPEVAPAPLQPQTPDQPASPSPSAIQPQASAPALITVLRTGPDGVEVLQSGTALPAAPDKVALDLISYSEAGEIELSGRAQVGSVVRVYLDNKPVGDLVADATGRWSGEVEGIVPGIYTMRLDELGQGGTVLSRIETPFKRESPDVLRPPQDPSAVARGDTASGGPVPPIRAVTVQQGDTLWAISRDRYGDGVLYVRVFEANRRDIRDPDLIYPGQVFALPE